MRQHQSVAQCARSSNLLPKKEGIGLKCKNSETSDTVFHPNAMILLPVYVRRNLNLNRKVSEKKITDSNSKPWTPITLLPR